MLHAQDKAFDKGTIVISGGVGLGIYKTKTHSEQTYGSVTFKDDTTDAAASVIYPITAEYGVTNWLGVGARFGFSNYFEEKENDTINGVAYSYQPKYTAVDLDLVLNFHLVKTKRFDMPVSLIIGYSKFKLVQNNPNTNPIGSPDNGGFRAKDNGTHYGIMVTPRIYFTDHFGMYFNAGYLGYSYNSLSFSNNSDSNLNDTYNWKFSLKGNGLNLGLGLVAKF